jgi:hypothetical protein
MKTVSPENLFPVDVIKETCNCGHPIDHPKVGIQRVYGRSAVDRGDADSERSDFLLS